MWTLAGAAGLPDPHAVRRPIAKSTIARFIPESYGFTIASSSDVNVQEIAERVAATLEPDAMVLLHQNWHHLLFLHWEVPPAELQALLPAGLDLDTFDGKAYVGLVPFTMTGVRAALTPPLPCISSLHDAHVR